MDLELRDKRALVTGGSRGIGRSTARALTREGGRVTIAVRERAGLEEAATEIAMSTGHSPSRPTAPSSRT
jgi:NAD(P)-dependent dehydrogenase (short-subunit alcohol dehydrogenase family)